MLLVTLTGKAGAVRRETFEQTEIRIGRIQENDLVIAEPNISKRHARIVIRDGRWILVDLKSTNGTYVNGRKMTSPLVVRADDKIYIGDHALELAEADPFEDEPTLEVEPTELRLLAAIAQRDEVSRIVYADWLEEQGDHGRAEFLRLQQAIVGMAPGDPAFPGAAARLRTLAGSIDVAWRYKVARPSIERCVRFELTCPNEWGSLATTERSVVRFCGTCEQPVYYATTIDEARAHAARGACVAVDIVPLRIRDDLAPRPPPMMGAPAAW